MGVFKVTRNSAPIEEAPRLIEAKTRKAAVAFVALSAFDAEPVTMREAMELAKTGVEIEASEKGDTL